MPDNKYGLGSSKVATEKHESSHKTTAVHATNCKFCNSSNLTLSPTMQDHLCNDCGQWQNDVPLGYSTGRAADY